MAASSMKDIKLRIKSVGSTMQITKAMELVASSKLRRAKARAEATRPYFTTLHECLNDIAYGNTEFSSPYVQVREVKKTCYIIIAGDRGLAGGYNNNLFKAAVAHMGDKPVCALPIGKKAVEYCRSHGIESITDTYARTCPWATALPLRACCAGSSTKVSLTRCICAIPILFPC